MAAAQLYTLRDSADADDRSQGMYLAEEQMAMFMAMSKNGPRRSGERGFSLLELMIAVVILGVLTSQMFVALSAQRRAGTGGERDLDLQESARLVADLIAYDARNAGMMVPFETAVSSVDGGGAYGSDRFCVSASNFFIVEKAWDNMTTRFPGAPATVVNGGASIQIPLTDPNGSGASVNIDASTTGSPDDWNPADQNAPATGVIPSVGVILAQKNGQGSWCSRVTSITVNAAAAPPNVWLNLAAPINASTPSYNVPTAQLTGSLIAVPAIIYELVDRTPPPVDTDPLCELWRNGTAVSTQIEDLQIEYWIDTLGALGTGGASPNGLRDLPGEFPVHRLLGLPVAPSPYTPLARIRDVRISVIARSPLESVKSNGLLRGRRPALANHAASLVADAFTRRSYSVNVLPRNLLNPDPNNLNSPE